MNISSSSISKHISKLEKECGVTLFNRTTRSVIPTEYGTAFFEYAKQIIELEEKGLAALKALHHERSGVLTIGYLPVMLEYNLVDVLVEFMRRYPGIEVKNLVGNRCSTLFDTDHCDFVFFDEYSQPGMNLNHVLCKKDHLVALLPPEHPLAGEQKISIGQLRQERFIMHGASLTELCRDSLEVCRLCCEAGFEPDMFLAAANIATIAGLVQKGIGISVMNRLLCPSLFSSKLAIVDLEPNATFSIYCLYKKGGGMSPTQKVFLSFIREFVQHWSVHEPSQSEISPDASR